MEQVLLSSMVVTDSDYQALASERVRVVREYILAGGKVEAERAFLAESQSDGLKNQGCRAYLRLK
jgi:hypothetical protein